MSLLKSAIGFFKSSPKLADDIFDKDKGLIAKTGAWIGNQNFTPEEQSEANAKMVKGVVAFNIATLNESTKRSETRRDIAVHIIKFYTVLLFWACLVYPFGKEWAIFVLNVATGGGIVALVTGVGAFFFGSHFWSSHVKGK